MNDGIGPRVEESFEVESVESEHAMRVQVKDSRPAHAGGISVNAGIHISQLSS